MRSFREELAQRRNILERESMPINSPPEKSYSRERESMPINSPPEKSYSRESIPICHQLSPSAG
jgi:hypothetical protein